MECVVDFEESRTRWSSGAHSVGTEMVPFQGFPQVASGTTGRKGSWQNSKSLLTEFILIFFQNRIFFLDFPFNHLRSSMARRGWKHSFFLSLCVIPQRLFPVCVRVPLSPTHAVALTSAGIADLCGLFLRSLVLSDKFAFYEVDSVYSTPMSSRTLAVSHYGSSSF